jgi:hypothetical protein
MATPGPSDQKPPVFTSAKELGFAGSPRGSELLRDRVEVIIASFNTAMEESQERTERLKQVVMKEAQVMVAMYEEAEAKRMEGLSKKMTELIEGVGSNLEEVGRQEEELQRFTASMALFAKDIPLD